MKKSIIAGIFGLLSTGAFASDSLIYSSEKNFKPRGLQEYREEVEKLISAMNYNLQEYNQDDNNSKMEYTAESEYYDDVHYFAIGALDYIGGKVIGGTRYRGRCSDNSKLDDEYMSVWRLSDWLSPYAMYSNGSMYGKADNSVDHMEFGDGGFHPHTRMYTRKGDYEAFKTEFDQASQALLDARKRFIPQIKERLGGELPKGSCLDAILSETYGLEK